MESQLPYITTYNSLNTLQGKVIHNYQRFGDFSNICHKMSGETDIFYGRVKIFSSFDHMTRKHGPYVENTVTLLRHILPLENATYFFLVR